MQAGDRNRPLKPGWLIKIRTQPLLELFAGTPATSTFGVPAGGRKLGS
ncbi:MAG TPA: hypothetical protein VII50_02480 [Acidothermaceae bacterium]